MIDRILNLALYCKYFYNDRNYVAFKLNNQNETDIFFKVFYLSNRIHPFMKKIFESHDLKVSIESSKYRYSDDLGVHYVPLMYYDFTCTRCKVKIHCYKESYYNQIVYENSPILSCEEQIIKNILE